jgi:C4-dicarboxylate-specific signal transduction histidine kinase
VERQDLSGDIAVLQQEVARVGRLVGALATSSASTASGSVDVNRLIADVVRLFRADARSAGIDISASSNDSAVAALLERDTLEQVLVNLVKNSIEAMSNPVARAAAKPEGARIIVANGGLVNRDGKLSLEINVRDNGPGMPGATLRRLFSGSPAQPDLAGASGNGVNGTTRGRGLAIVHQLVDSMGGAIVCRSSGSGTSFEILLPFSPILQPETDSGPK